jgi:hypothetical protein
MSSVPTPQNAPASGRSRTIKIATLYRVGSRWGRETRVPFIRLSGKWLASLGFVAESRVIVRGESGCLTITTLPQPSTLPAQTAG